MTNGFLLTVGNITLNKEYKSKNGKIYRIANSIGRHMNRCYEVQEKYYYYDLKHNTYESWKTCFISTDIDKCKKVLEKYLKDNSKSYSIPYEDLLFLWN